MACVVCDKRKWQNGSENSLEVVDFIWFLNKRMTGIESLKLESAFFHEMVALQKL